MLNIKVNNSKVFQIGIDKEVVEVDDKVLDFDIRSLGNNCFSVLYHHKSYNIEVVELDRIEKKIDVKINGHLYALNVADQFDQLLQKMGLDKLTQNKIVEVKAPMPGLVLAIKVKEGTAVSKGESLLILEAMKMENIIKSPADGVIKKVLISEGKTVDKNQLLMVFE